MHLARSILITGLGTLLGGCYGATLERMEDQLSAQRREIKVLRESFEAQRVSMRSLRDRLALLEDKAESVAIHGLRAPRPLPVVKLKPPAAPPPVEEAATTITQADLEPRRRTRRGPGRAVEPPANAAFAGNIGVVPIAPPVAAPADAAPLPKRVTRPAQADDTQPMDQALLAFRRARGLYDRGNIAAATVAFEGFVRDHPQHDFADNALFLLGKARFEQARYPAALKAFRSVVEQHPTGNKVPSALLMIGRSQIKLGQVTEGRETLARLVALFPGGAAARQASKVLGSPERM